MRYPAGDLAVTVSSGADWHSVQAFVLPVIALFSGPICRSARRGAKPAGIVPIQTTFCTIKGLLRGRER